MKHALIPLTLVLFFCASGFVGAQFNIPGIPNPFAPSHPSTPTSPGNVPINGIGDMVKGASGISLQDELKIGGAVAVDIVARNGGLVEDEAMTHHVALIGKSLSSYCSRPELNFRFGILNTDSINAFSAPGGYVFITRGLYNSVQGDQQLAAVLAHEISHITKRHALKIISRNEFMKGLFSTGGAVANISVFDNGVASISNTLMSKGFDPSSEYEADHEGRALASKAGYQRDALLDFLTQLYQVKGDSKEAFNTHPPLSHRIERLKNK
jgi:predicted Zn-dependent protease